MGTGHAAEATGHVAPYALAEGGNLERIVPTGVVEARSVPTVGRLVESLPMPVADDHLRLLARVLDHDLRADPGEVFEVLSGHGDDVLAGLQVGQEVVALRPLPAVALGELADLLAVDE